MRGGQNSEADMWQMYRFADTLDEVNWSARYRPDNAFMSQYIIPGLIEKTEDSIKRVTFRNDELNAVIGISGGLDSCVSAWVAATSMRESLKKSDTKDSSLVLLSFNGLSPEDLEYGRRFSKDIEQEFPEVNVAYEERDLRPLLKDLHLLTDGLIHDTGKKKDYVGTLPTRLIDTLIMEYADETEHCAIDPTNGSEVVLGEIVVGCGMDYAPLADLYKSEVFDIGELLGVPDYILQRNPINSAFGIDKIKAYFGEMPEGMKARDVYAVIDPVLYHIFELKMDSGNIAKKLGHSQSFIDRGYTRVRNQDNRRSPPYFALNDKVKTFERSITALPNGRFEDYTDRCFLGKGI